MQWLTTVPWGIEIAVLGGAALLAATATGAALLMAGDGGGNSGDTGSPTSARSITPTPADEPAEFGYEAEGADSPEASVRLLLEGITENNQDKILNATDPDFRDESLTAANIGIFVQGLFSFFTGADIGQPPVSFLDLSLSYSYEDDPTIAVVMVSGRMRALGRETTLTGEEIPTVKKFGRWFVTSFDHPYFVAKSQRQEAAATATAEAAAAAAQATRAAGAQQLSIAVGKPQIVGAAPAFVNEPDAAAYVMVEMDVTFHNGDVAAHSIEWQPDAGEWGSGLVTCPPGSAGYALPVEEDDYSPVLSGPLSASLPPGRDSTTTLHFSAYCASDTARVPPLSGGSDAGICVVSVDGDYGVGLSGFPPCDES